MASSRFKRTREDFVCYNCGFKVYGSGYTDHCPKCLWGKHVDINPGDRQSKCLGKMKPVGAIDERNNIIIFYRCTKCGSEKRFKASAYDDREGLYKLIKSSKNDQKQ